MLSLRARLIKMLLKYWLGPKFLKQTSVEGKRNFAEQFSKHNRLPVNTKIEPSIILGIPVEWVSVGTVPDNKVLVYFHGGGYVMGSLNTHRELAARIAKASGVKVLLVDYRLAPENVYPAALEDAEIIYQWLLNNSYVASDITIAGDSAGGGLTISALVKLRDKNLPLPRAAICLSPWVDLEVIGESVALNAGIDPYVNVEVTKEMGRLYSGKSDLRMPHISPIYADLTGLPPLLIHVGSDEILLDDATRLYQRAIDCDVDVTLDLRQGMFHVWHTFAGIMPEAKQAVDDVGRFVKHHLEISG